MYLNTRTCSSLHLRTCLSLTLILGSSVAYTQGVLEEIIVTAEKRETSLQDTPIAVNAFSNEALERGLITNNMDIQMAVPNMLMSRDFFTSGLITIRGVGKLGVGTSTDEATGIHFNGVYLNNSRIFETEYFDTERVEVLRGPQGTLYGRNTTAGVINVLSAAPAEELGGDLSFSYGDYDQLKIKGALNLPLTDSIQQRFALFYLERDGYVTNTIDGDDVDGRDMYALRSSTRFTLGERTEAQLVINYFEEDSDRMRGSGARCVTDPDGVLGCLPNSNQAPGPSNTAGTVGGFLTRAVGGATGESYPVNDNAGRIVSSDPREVDLDTLPVYEADETIISLQITHEFDDYTLTSLTGYQDSNLDARNDYDFGFATGQWPSSFEVDRGPDPTITVDYLYQGDRSTVSPTQYTQELRLQSELDGPINFLLGGFYLDYDSETHYYIYSSALSAFGETFGIPRDQWVFDNDTSNYNLDSWALFGELYYDLSERTELTLGARYTDETKEADNRTIYLGFLDDPASDNGGYLPLKDDWQETTGKVSLTHHLSDGAMIYGTLARSYKSGGFNPISPESTLLNLDFGGDPSLSSFDPEYINSLELGARTRWRDDSLQANITAFYYDYEDLQVSKIINNTSLNENIDAEIFGVEGEFTWAPTPRWVLTSNLSWLKTELDDYETFDPSNPNQMDTVDGILSVADGNIYLPCNCPGLDVNVQGNELPNAPEFSAFISARYTLPLTQTLGLSLFSSYYWQDDFYSRIFNTQDDQLDDWNVWNASATLASLNASWYAEVWIRNIEDEEIVTGEYLQGPSVGLFRTYQLLEPRTYGVTLGYSF